MCVFIGVIYKVCAEGFAFLCFSLVDGNDLAVQRMMYPKAAVHTMLLCASPNFLSMVTGQANHKYSSATWSKES